MKNKGFFPPNHSRKMRTLQIFKMSIKVYQNNTPKQLKEADKYMHQKTKHNLQY